MSENQFEVKRDGSIVGIFAVPELKQLARDGRLGPNDFVREVGTQLWQKAGDVQISDAPVRPTPPPSPSGRDEHIADSPKKPASSEFGVQEAASQFAYMAWPVTALVEFLRRFWGGTRFATESKWATRAGHVLLMVFTVLLIAQLVIAATKSDTWAFASFAIPLNIFIMAVLQYIAQQFISAGSRLLASSPTVVNNNALLDVFGLLAFATCIGAVVFGVYGSISMADTEILAMGVGVAIFSYLVSSLAFSPETLNIGSGDETSAGDEVVGILTFFVKSLLVIGPFVYAGGAFLACRLMCYEIKFLIDEDPGFVGEFEATQLMLLAGVYPLFLYVLFLIYYIFVDLLRAIFNLDRNVQALRLEEDRG